MSNVVAIAAGGVFGYYPGVDFSLALQSDGTIVAWGYDGFGETDVPPGLSNVIAVAAGGLYAMALQSNGTIVAWGDGNSPQGLSNVIAIAIGGGFNLALQGNGTVVAWGDAFFGGTNVPVGLSNVIAIAAGIYHGLALQSSGTVVAWGNDDSGQTNVPDGLSNVVAIAAGGDYSLALQGNGQVVAWGFLGLGVSTVPPGLSNVVAIATSDDTAMALKANGTVVVWGYNEYGQTNVPPGLSNVVAIAAGSDDCLCLTYSPPSSPLPPANDDFENAILLTGTNATVTGSNVGATTEPGETNYIDRSLVGASLWWTWTPEQNGTLTVAPSPQSSFDALLGVYTGGNISNLFLVASVSYGSPATFNVTAGTQYYIMVGGDDGEQGAFSFNFGEFVCFPPEPNPPVFTTSQTNESDGIHVIFCADVQGTDLAPYVWSVISPSHFISTFDNGNCFEVVVPATNEQDVIVNLTVSNPCGTSGGNSSGVSPCGMCLSRGTPFLQTSAAGGGTGLTAFPTLDCGSIGPNAYWYRMIADATGLVTVSTEGSSAPTVLGIFGGAWGSQTNITCYNGFTSPTYQNDSRITFNAVMGTAYWVAVDPRVNTAAQLRIASGYQPYIQSSALMPDGSFTLQSSTAPPITYTVLAASALSTNTNAWTVVLTTNLTLRSPFISFRDTNVQAVPQRFYQLGSDQ